MFVAKTNFSELQFLDILIFYVVFLNANVGAFSPRKEQASLLVLCMYPLNSSAHPSAPLSTTPLLNPRAATLSPVMNSPPNAPLFLPFPLSVKQKPCLSMYPIAIEPTAHQPVRSSFLSDLYFSHSEVKLVAEIESIAA